MSGLPTTFRALELSSYEGSAALRVVERPLLPLEAGEVRIRVHAAPANPSDLLFLRGLYGVKKPLPTVPGFEASGVVVEGRGAAARALVGQRVAFSAPNDRDGTWAEYAVTRASLCFPLRAGVDLEQGAMLIVNPLTAWSFLVEAKAGKHEAIVHTAAAGALGRWLVRLARIEKVVVLHVVRRPEQAELLRSLGERHVFDSSTADFDSTLRSACKELGATLAFDAVAGSLASRLLQALPPASTLCVYGALSGEPVLVNPGDLIFRDKGLRGLWLPRTFTPKTMPQVHRGASLVQREMVKGDFGTAVAERVSLDEMPAALERYAGNMTRGKVLVLPGPRGEQHRASP